MIRMIKVIKKILGIKSPSKFEDLVNFDAEDDDEIVVVVSCAHFERNVASPRTNHDFGFDC